jgi:hypothetical protein
MRAVHVLFYKPQPDDLWLNHVVTFVSPPYSHCDIQFENEMASSIYQNETVYMEKKSFSRLNYERISLTFTDQEYSKIYMFCDESHRSQVKFDPVGMIGSFIPLYSFRPSKKTFCSRYVTEALQASGRPEYKELKSARISPSGLHAFLASAQKSFLHIPSKRLMNVKN